MLILKNCRFIPYLTEGTDLNAGDVLVNDGKIEKIAPVGTDFGVEAEVMDLEGKTLMPGLIDLHMHLFYENMSSLMNGKGQPAPTMALNCLRYAQEMLKDGYTTIRDCGDIHSWPAKYVRDFINAGKADGPRIMTSGPIISSNWTTLDTIDVFTCGADGFRDESRKAFAKGADFVKLYSSGSLLMPSNEPGYTILEPEEIEQAVLIAKRNSSYVAAHAHGVTAIDQCVRAGVHSIEHASMITEEILNYIDENKLDTALVYTMYAIDEILEEPETYNGKRMHMLWDRIRGCLKNAYENHKNILIGWGTDVSYDKFITDPMREFRLRKEYLDMSNEDILKQATINSAKIVYKDNEIGSVKEGKAADFVVIDGNPDEDITVMYSVPAHVIKGGKVIR